MWVTEGFTFGVECTEVSSKTLTARQQIKGCDPVQCEEATTLLDCFP